MLVGANLKKRPGMCVSKHRDRVIKVITRVAPALWSGGPNAAERLTRKGSATMLIGANLKKDPVCAFESTVTGS